ncbi:Histone-lysine N-methyltransferase SETMAR [Eumeta japonica]|uniref:Histone-lysine N-methyltransferase SETMAR n=1 Tax=Eumeta variegata TaxID=151549 RepID=A0A4C1XLP7_EUMVA|nr:Histone-lysine N-methyltransferase SETMAR [Eumeta japonica]
MSTIVAQNWFKRFQSGNFDVKDEFRSGRPATDKVDAILGKDIIHYELLPPGKTINSDLYCQLLMRFKQELEKKWPEFINRKAVVFHHDNARPHTFLATQQILREFGWEKLMHPSYSHYLAPADFYPFRSLQKFLGSVSDTACNGCNECDVITTAAFQQLAISQQRSHQPPRLIGGSPAYITRRSITRHRHRAGCPGRARKTPPTMTHRRPGRSEYWHLVAADAVSADSFIAMAYLSNINVSACSLNSWCYEHILQILRLDNSLQFPLQSGKPSGHRV